MPGSRRRVGRAVVAAAAVALAVLAGCRERGAGSRERGAGSRERAQSAADAVRPSRRGPSVQPLWQIDLALAPEATGPVAAHRGPRPVADGLAVESNLAGYAVVRPSDGRLLRRKPHRPLSPVLPRPSAARIDWPVGDGERYASVPGAVTRAGGVVRAVAVDGGVGPATIDRDSGRRIARGERGARVSVMSAAWSPSGALAVAVRFSDGGLPVLKDDAVLGFAADGTLAWRWPLPVPAAERGDPAGLWASDTAVYVFFDGRRLAALPSPGEAGMNRSSTRQGEEPSPEKVTPISPP